MSAVESSSNQELTKKDDCKLLPSAEIKNLNDAESMNSSHNWIFQKSDNYGKSGVLVMCYCKCGAKKMTLTVNYESSMLDFKSE
ncbi:MAG: hypothetical protein ACYC7D_04095 [Nitrososphaerales archaeon]